jgi:hypothetical protein
MRLLGRCAARVSRAPLHSWPSVESLDFKTKGERIGIILNGLSLLEKHKADFPETYKTANDVVHNRLKDFKAPEGSDASYQEYGLLKDVAGAMISMISALAK